VDSDGLSDAGNQVDNVPGVGAQSLAEAGREQQHSVDQLAIVTVALLLIVPLGLGRVS
jgi:hypothetical protein